MRGEYNELTKRLLKEGYTVNNFPKDMVKIPGGSYGEANNPLDNIYGGFEYVRYWIYQQTFETPCGLLCKGESCMSDMMYRGIEWSYENDMAYCHCPYDNSYCTKKHEYLQDNSSLRFICNVHMTTKEYQYSGSLEEKYRLHNNQKQILQEEFISSRNGRVCRHHMSYNRDEKKWEFNYDPNICVTNKCRGYCPVLGRTLDKKRGNVYYDIKESGIDYSLNGTLFEGQTFTNIIKSNRAFKNPVSMDICNNYVKLCSEELRHHVLINKYHTELFFAKLRNEVYDVEIINIRAESKPSRDLFQDLEDIKNGASIVHASDLQRKEREEKQERRDKAKHKKIKKLEKKIIDEGFNYLNYSDARYVEKNFSSERIYELETLHFEKVEEEKKKPVQLTLFDIGMIDNN